MTPKQPWTLLANVGSSSGVSWFGLRDDDAPRPLAPAPVPVPVPVPAKAAAG